MQWRLTSGLKQASQPSPMAGQFAITICLNRFADRLCAPAGHSLPEVCQIRPDTTKTHSDAPFRRSRAIDQHHHREAEYGRLLPATLQVHVARIPLLSSGAETAPRGGDTDVDYQARLLSDAKVAVVALAQTAASLRSDGFDDQIIRRMSEAAGVPATTSARAIGLAVRALGARRIALVAPFPVATLKLLERYYTTKYGLEVVANESFSGTDSVVHPTLGQQLARDAITRTDQREIEVVIVPGGNFPTMSFISDWELAIGKPVITTNQATLWAMLQIMRADEVLPGLGRLLEEMPAMGAPHEH
jgi:maleate isomerase